MKNVKTIKNLLIALILLISSVGLNAQTINKEDTIIIINVDTTTKIVDSVKHITYFLYSGLNNKLELIDDMDLFNLQSKQAKQQRWEPYKVILIYSASIMFNAIGDGLNDSRHNIAGHIWNAASIGTLLLSPAIFNYQKDKWWVYLLTYTSLRIALFDYTYNTTRHLPLNYLDNSSSVTDRMWNFFGNKQMAFPRAVVGAFAISISFKL